MPTWWWRPAPGIAAHPLDSERHELGSGPASPAHAMPHEGITFTELASARREAAIVRMCLDKRASAKDYPSDCL